VRIVGGAEGSKGPEEGGRTGVFGVVRGEVREVVGKGNPS